MVDESVADAHEILRSLMYPMLKDKLDDADWILENSHDFQLFKSINFFAEKYSSKPERQAIIEKKSNELLLYDHEKLRESIYPIIKPIMDSAPELLKGDHYYNLYSDRTYFGEAFPTHQERQCFIEDTNRVTEVQDAGWRNETRQCRRLTSKMIDRLYQKRNDRTR